MQPQAEDLVRRVGRLAGIQTSAHARATLESVLDALGALVPHPRRGAIASELPGWTAEAFERREYDRALGRPWLLQMVSKAEHVRPGAALEHVEAVLAMLREHLDADRFRLLVAELPEEVRALVPPAPSKSRLPPRPEARSAAPSRRLAGARPGPGHPIAEADGPPLAHTHSVAANADPHGDTKLSEARGLTQAREHEDLAEGRPGPARPISEPEG